jgi:hypothetical protein
VSASSIAMNAALAPVDRAQVDAFIDRGLNEALAVALVQGDIIIDHGSDALPLNPHAKSLIARELEWLAKQTSPSLPRKRAQEVGGWAQTKGLALQALGILRTFNLDARVQVSTRDIARYRLAQILLSYPIDGPKLKIRQPKARFKKQRRESTPQELAALHRANDARKEGKQRRLLEDKQRREAKVAARV